MLQSGNYFTLPRQLSCRDMCKIVTRLEKHVFLQEFAQELKTLWEIGP